MINATQFVGSHWGVIVSMVATGTAAKIFTVVARAQPPLPPDAPYFVKWFSNVLQGWADNQDKLSSHVTLQPEVFAATSTSSVASSVGSSTTQNPTK